MTKEEKFIEGLYDEAEEEMKVVYDKQKENEKELLKEIALIMLTYTVLESVMTLSLAQRNKELTRLTKVIKKAAKGQAKLQEETILKTLTSITGKTFKFYSYNKGLKDVRKIIESNFKGKHFSTRVWGNEDKVSKYLEKQIKQFLDGKIGVNDIKTNIQKGFGASEYNARRLAETEIARCSSTAFDRFCKEVGAKKVRYNATLDSRTCPKCSPHDGKPFDFDKKIELPQHASCRCFYEIIDENNKKEVSNSGKDDIIKEIRNDSKNFTVNREYINSEEYKSKFDGIGSKKQNDVVCKETKNVIKRNDGKNTEMMSIVDKNGKVLTNQSAGSFGGSIDLSCLEKMPDNSVVLTHNHPLSSSFSDSDLALLMDNPQVKTIVAGGHDGTVYRLSVGKGTRTEINNLTGKNSIIQEYRRLLDIVEKPNKVMESLAKKYNWKYEVI